MTVRFLAAVEALGYPVRFVDRRFSRRVDEVGRASVRKAIAVIGLLLRTVWTVVRWRPAVTVFFVTTRPGSFVVDWAVSEVLRLGRRRRVLYVHSVGFAALAARGGIWGWLVQRFLASATSVVCLGPTLTSDVTPFVPAARITCIPNTPEHAAAEETSARGVPTALFMSNFIAGKGADVFARVCGILSVRHSSWRFIMAGHAGDADAAAVIDAAIAESGASASIARPGALAGAAKWDALRSAACLAFTSELIEAQPLTIIEALSCGTPVVAFRLGGIPDLIDDGVDGFLVEPGDEIGFAQRVAMLLANDGLREAMSRAARARFEEHHSESAFTAHWEQLIDGIAR